LNKVIQKTVNINMTLIY